MTGSVVSSPAVADATVYVGGTDGRVHAIDARSGDARWTFRAGAGIVSSPAVADGVVYVGTDDGTLYALGTPLLADGTPTRRRFNPDPFVPSATNATG